MSLPPVTCPGIFFVKQDHAFILVGAYSVEVSANACDGRGYDALKNHREKACKARLIGRQRLKSAVEIRDQEQVLLEVNGVGEKMELAGYGGVFVEWKL